MSVAARCLTHAVRHPWSPLAAAQSSTCSGPTGRGGAGWEAGEARLEYGECSTCGKRALPALLHHMHTQPALCAAPYWPEAYDLKHPSSNDETPGGTKTGRTHLWLWMYMMGTPGILRMRRRRSRSHVATM